MSRSSKEFETVIERFRVLSERQPNAIALTIEPIDGEHRHYTYAEVQMRIDQLSHFLSGKIALANDGKVKGSIVGVTLNRSLDCYATIYALWQLGCVFVPIPHTLEHDKFNYRVDHSGACAIVTAQALLNPDHFPNVTCINVSEHADDIAHIDVVFEPVDLTPDDLAYIIFTSGTTGDPKGIAITHEAIVNRADSVIRIADLKQTDVFLQWGPFEYDRSLMEIWLAWCSGGRLCASEIPSSELVLDFVSVLNRLGITNLITPPDVLSMLQREYRDYADLSTLFTTLKHLMSATAAFDGDLCRWCFRLGCHVYNGYGATETTIGATTGICTEDSIVDGRVSVGRYPGEFFDGLQAFVMVDGELRVEGEGELYLAGSGLMHGYWKDGKRDKDATDAVMVTLPIPGDGEAKLFKSGDVMRLGPDGQTFFLRRVDRQVQVNGFRVELPALEVVLKEHTAVDDAFIVQSKGQLIGFLLLNEAAAEPATPVMLNAALRSASMPVLANYRVADAFAIESLRRGYTVPHENLTLLATADRTMLVHSDQRAVDEMFCDILPHYRDSSADADFLIAGGSSLGYAELRSNIVRAFGVELVGAFLPETISPETLGRYLILQRLYANAFVPLHEDTQSDAHSPVVFFIHPLAGGATGHFQALFQHLNVPGLRAYAVRVPLLNNMDDEDFAYYRDHVSESMEEQARFIALQCAAVLGGLKQKHSDKPPVHIVGWSYGGPLGYAVAACLRELKFPVGLLGILDSQAPGVACQLPVAEHSARLIRILKTIAKEAQCPDALEGIEAAIAGVIDLKAQVNALFDFALHAIAAKRTLPDRDVGDAVLDKFEKMMRVSWANSLAVLRYEPKGVFEVERAICFVAQPDPATTSTESVGVAQSDCRPDDWNRYFNPHALDVVPLPGETHMNITRNDMVAETLTRALGGYAEVAAARAASLDEAKPGPSTLPRIDVVVLEDAAIGGDATLTDLQVIGEEVGDVAPEGGVSVAVVRGGSIAGNFNLSGSTVIGRRVNLRGSSGGEPPQPGLYGGSATAALFATGLRADARVVARDNRVVGVEVRDERRVRQVSAPHQPPAPDAMFEECSALYLPDYRAEWHVDRLLLDAQLNNAFKNHSIVLCKGPEDVGKSHLARVYCENTADEYTFRGWIQGGDAETVKANFIRLGETLNLVAPEWTEQKKIQKILNAFSKRDDWLLVIDGIEDQRWLTFERQSRSLLSLGGCVLLVASDTANFLWNPTVNVGEMTEAQAVQLLQTVCNSTDPEFVEVVALVGRQPSDLMAAAQHLNRLGMTPADYIERQNSRP